MRMFHGCSARGPGRWGRILAGLVVATALAGRLEASRNESIAISATAAPAYVRALDAQGHPRPETYIFSEGHFMGGTTADASEKHFKFADVTKVLAQSLAKQNYYPTTDVPSANLIIMVHWGTTLIYEDPQKEFTTENLNNAVANYNAGIAANGTTDPGELNAAIDQVETAQQGQQGAIARNARLLGYKRDLDKEQKQWVPSQEELRMSIELNEERYFVVLMAYDYQFMQKEHKPRLLWVTRLSVRSPGNNFVEALPTLSRVGADVFGKQIDGLVRVKTPLGSGSVKLRELEILGAVENKPAEKAGK